MLCRRKNDCEMNGTKKKSKNGEACETAVSLLNILIFHVARFTLFFKADYIE